MRWLGWSRLTDLAHLETDTFADYSKKEKFSFVGAFRGDLILVTGPCDLACFLQTKVTVQLNLGSNAQDDALKRMGFVLEKFSRI